MKRIRFIGLALVAVFALSAVVASAASASKFEAQTYPVEIKGEEKNQEFTVESGTINCTGKFSASATGPLVELPVTAAYTGCTFALFELPKVNMGACSYLFHAGEEIAGQPGHFKGTADVVPAGCEIKVETATCVVTVPSQTGLTGIEYVNSGTGSAEVVIVHANVPNIKYKEALGCTTTIEHNNGVYKGTVTVKGVNKTTKAADGIFLK